MFTTTEGEYGTLSGNNHERENETIFTFHVRLCLVKLLCLVKHKRT